MKKKMISKMYLLINGEIKNNKNLNINRILLLMKKIITLKLRIYFLTILIK